MNTYTHLAAANAAVTDRFLNSVDMKNGAYALDETTSGTAGARRLTLTHTSENDYYEYPGEELGTVTVVGKDLSGQAVTEVLTPVADDTVTGTRWFVSLTSVTGAGWVEAGGVADTIELGHGADICVLDGVGILRSVIVNTSANGTITLADANGTIGIIKASVAEGDFEYDIAVSGYLTVDLNAASDVTVVHTGSLPQTYAMS